MLNDAPPSANPDYLLPSTQSIISFALTLDKKIIREFMGKKDWLSHYEEQKHIARSLFPRVLLPATKNKQCSEL